MEASLFQILSDPNRRHNIYAQALSVGSTTPLNYAGVVARRKAELPPVQVSWIGEPYTTIDDLIAIKGLVAFHPTANLPFPTVLALALTYENADTGDLQVLAWQDFDPPQTIQETEETLSCEIIFGAIRRRQ